MSDTFTTHWGATEVANRVGITLRQLYYWERLGIVRPRRENFGDRISNIGDVATRVQAMGG